MSPLEAILSVEPRSDEGAHARLRGEVPDGWHQGRGAFGGLVIGMMARAMASMPAVGGRALRSLSAELIGPVMPGLVEIEVETLRAGTGVITFGARALQEGQVQAHSVGVLGKRRVEDGDWNDAEPFSAPPWQDVPSLDFGPPMAPAFAQHFEFRPTGPLPFSGQAPRAGGWVRPRAPPVRWDAALIAAMADAWWPAAFSRLDGPRPIATVAYSLQLVADPADVPLDAPMHHRGHAIAARDGYTVEQRQLHDATGRLLAFNQQTIALIR